MKRICVVVVVFMALHLNLSAYDYNAAFCSRLHKIGCTIENVTNVPVIGKLTNLFPIAVLVTGLKEYPVQTAMAFAITGVYFLYSNEKVRTILARRGALDYISWNGKKRCLDHDIITDDIFVFDEDCEDLEITEDGFLQMDLLTEEEQEEVRKAEKNKLQKLLL